MKPEPLPSMRKAPSTKAGYSLVEIILAGAIFALMITAFIDAIIYGEQNTALAGERSRAVFLAEEGLEAVRNIRDEKFSNLVDGSYGLAISGNQWTLSGINDQTGMFTRQITIASIDSNTKNVTSTVTWQQTPQRTGNVSLITRLNNWKSAQADNLIINTDNANTRNRDLLDITLANSDPSNSIIIDRIRLSWPSPVNLSQIRINNSTVWSGSRPSGTEINITNVTLTPGATGIDINRFRFNHNVGNGNFTLTMIMADGSQKTVTFFAN